MTPSKQELLKQKEIIRKSHGEAAGAIVLAGLLVFLFLPLAYSVTIFSKETFLLIGNGKSILVLILAFQVFFLPNLLGFFLQRVYHRFLYHAQFLVLTRSFGTALIFFALHSESAGLTGLFDGVRIFLPYFGLNYLFFSGYQYVFQWLTNQRWPWNRKTPSSRTALIIGAIENSVRLLEEMNDDPEIRISPIGFVDSDNRKKGARFSGLPVLGSIDELEQILIRTGATDALIPGKFPASTIKEIRKICEKRGVHCKNLPALSELLARKPFAPPLPETINAEDLLGRDVVDLEIENLLGEIRGKNVLITGAGGSIGSEVCRQLIRFEPASMVLLDHAETPLYEIDYELRNSPHHSPYTGIVSVISDIRDERSLNHIFRNHDFHLVFHCAAYKHVPMMELNASEAVKNNVIGTKNLAHAARDSGVDRFVMISTDKAVNPVNIMGATKRIAELYIQNLARTVDTRFITVRFGNVLGSSGSVIPLFQKQIASGGPVTVTHPEIIRFFMTIEEAAGLVIQAGIMGREGEIFILDMGKPMRIKDLAEDMIRLAGYEPYRDIEIRYIGLRPGEKLFEELLLAEEGIEPTRHEKIHIARSRIMNLETLEEKIKKLNQACESSSRQKIDSIIASMLPEYRPVYTIAEPAMEIPPSPAENDLHSFL